MGGHPAFKAFPEPPGIFNTLLDIGIGGTPFPLRQIHRTPDDFSLGDVPSLGQPLKPVRSCLIQRESGPMIHCWHAIISYHCIGIVKASELKEEPPAPRVPTAFRFCGTTISTAKFSFGI